MVLVFWLKALSIFPSSSSLMGRLNRSKSIEMLSAFLVPIKCLILNFSDMYQLKKYVESRTSLRSKSPRSGKAGKDNDGKVFWKFSDRFSSIGVS